VLRRRENDRPLVLVVRVPVENDLEIRYRSLRTALVEKSYSSEVRRGGRLRRLRVARHDELIGARRLVAPAEGVETPAHSVLSVCGELVLVIVREHTVELENRFFVTLLSEERLTQKELRAPRPHRSRVAKR